MPKVTCVLVFEGNHGNSGEALLAEVREILETSGITDFRVVSLEHLGTTLTDDELDEIRWQSDGGAHDD